MTLDLRIAHALADRCRHPRVEARVRVNAAGRRYYQRQYLDCAEAVGTQIASASALAGGHEPPPFEEESLAQSRAETRRFYAEQAVARKQAWWDWYDAYLLTEAWRTKRVQVLKRDNGLCQGCLKRQATQVHHLTYDHVGDELLFELASICDECHERAHARGRR
jgi:hypothetical protein